MITVVGTLVMWQGPRLVRRVLVMWLRWARTRPSLDPFAGRVGTAQRSQLEAALAEAVADPQWITLDRALGLAMSDRWGWAWRDGVRRLQPLVVRALARDPDSVDLEALQALVHAHLGELDEAKAQVDRLPSDHWRACYTRALLYDAAGDLGRTSAALVAALELAPPPARPFLIEQLERFAEEHG